MNTRVSECIKNKIMSKNRIIILVSSLVFLLTISCFPGKKITGTGPSIVPLSDTVKTRNGTLVYSLPRTVFTIIAEMERTIEIPGPYAQFAGDMLGLDRVIKSENEFWSVKSISVRTHEEADPSEYYVIQTGSFFTTNALSLRKEGLIMDLNPTQINTEKGSLHSREVDSGQFQSFDLGSDEYYQVQSDTAYRRVSLDSTFIRIPYIVEKKKKLAAAQLAERAAKRLMDLREGKIMILTGEANVFPQNDAALNEMNKLEKEYTELFTGRRITQTRWFTYHLIPNKDQMGKSVVLFRFSELTGPAETSSKTGTPVTLELIPEQKTKELVVISPPAPIPPVSSNDKLYYRVPDIANLRIRIGTETIYNSRKMIYQFGEVIQLPGSYLIGK
jgi:hypothetical protein